MRGRELVDLLEGAGFMITRRVKTFVWLSRGKDVLLIDEAVEIPEEVVQELLARESPSSESP